MAEPLKEARTAKQMVDRLASNLDAEQLAQLQRHSAKTKPQSTRKRKARSIIEMLPGAEDETGAPHHPSALPTRQTRGLS